MTDDGYTVAYQGVAGAFSETPARRWAGVSGQLRPCQTLLTMMQALAAGQVQRAVVPLENSIAGPVPGARELIEWFGVEVLDQFEMPIRHALIALPGTSLSDLSTVWSHPVALAQCTRFLSNYRHLSACAWFDTAGAVRDVVALGDPRVGAIAAANAATTHGAAVLVDGIQDRDDNVTRFALVCVRGDRRQRMETAVPSASVRTV